MISVCNLWLPVDVNVAHARPSEVPGVARQKVLDFLVQQRERVPFSFPLASKREEIQSVLPNACQLFQPVFDASRGVRAC